jgi:hypothetical protein
VFPLIFSFFAVGATTSYLYRCLYEWMWESIFACPLCEPTDFVATRGICSSEGKREIKYVTDGITCQGDYRSATGKANTFVEPCEVITRAETPQPGHVFLIGTSQIKTNQSRDVELFAARLQTELENVTLFGSAVEIISIVGKNDDVNVTFRVDTHKESEPDVVKHLREIALNSTSKWEQKTASLGTLVSTLVPIDADSRGANGNTDASGSKGGGMAGGTKAMVAFLVLILVGLLAVLGYKYRALKTENYSLMHSSGKGNYIGGGDDDDGSGEGTSAAEANDDEDDGHTPA